MKFERTPLDYNTKRDFMDSVWQNSERETIARNIVMIQDEEFEPFTFVEYVDRCDHSSAPGDEWVVKALADEGYLDRDGDTFMVNFNFLAAIEKYRN